MAFRPVDMQIMTPRMADLSILHQAERERPVLEQMQMVAHQNKQVEKDKQVVRKTSRDSQMKNEADAKEKGKNCYTYHPGRKKGKQITRDEDYSGEGNRSLDIKI